MAIARKRLRVLNVIYRPLRIGGAERVAVELAARLDRQRFESSLCVLEGPDTLCWTSRELQDMDIRLHVIQRRSARDIAGLCRYAELVRHKFDIVHAHLWDAHVWTAAALLGRRGPIFVAHEHT